MHSLRIIEFIDKNTITALIFINVLSCGFRLIRLPSRSNV